MGESKTVALNRRARFDYEIEETIEAGIILKGSEVKSMRDGGVSLTEAYASQKGEHIVLYNAHIPPYKSANRFNHDPKRVRVLLLHKREISRLIGKIKQDRVTLIPLALYFNRRGIAKIELGVGHGKRKADKRETQKQRDWQRQKEQLFKNKDRS